MAVKGDVIYTDEQISEWLEDWSSSITSLSSFFSGHTIIHFRQLYRRMAESDKIRQDYVRAMETRAERYNADIDDIAEEIRTGQLDAAQARVILDARKWQASKLAPKKYGDRMEVESKGEVAIIWKEEKTYEEK